MGAAVVQPQLNDKLLIAADGFELPMRSWLPAHGHVRAAVVALHGYNDYSNAFDGAGREFATAGIATYAYDQRGFGATRNRGVWAGTPTLVSDAGTLNQIG